MYKIAQYDDWFYNTGADDGLFKVNGIEAWLDDLKMSVGRDLYLYDTLDTYSVLLTKEVSVFLSFKRS